jgi:quercetin dioxygenase-like cupin family protein
MLPEWVSGNIYIRPNPLPKAGDTVQGHTHKFDHTTIVFIGGVHVKAVLPDGSVIERDFHAPDYFLVRADVTHEITALVDGTVFWCVYSHREPQGQISQTRTGWDEAYH